MKMNTKSKLISSLLVLVLCVTAFAGSTYAWFTDEVVSSGNKIQAGNLDIELYQLESTMTDAQKAENLDSDGTYANITESTNPIFDYDRWEPGYTAVKALKIKNAGNLALTWSADLIANGSIADYINQNAIRLSDVIDVYVTVDKAQVEAIPNNLEGITSTWTNAGSLTDFILGFGKNTKGILETAGQEAYLGLALHMQEDANNDYQGKDLGGTFDILIHADQYTKEADAFDNQYDADSTDIPRAGVNELPVVEEEVLVFNGALSGTNQLVTFDKAYVFMATESAEEGADSDYADWLADFVVSFDQDVKAGDIMLAGRYDAFTELGLGWLGFPLPEDLAADTEVCLLTDLAEHYAGRTLPVSYSEVCTFQQFKCAAASMNDTNMSGKTMTVELRLYETCDACRAGSCSVTGHHGNSANQKTDNYIVIGTFKHTF